MYDEQPHLHLHQYELLLAGVRWPSSTGKKRDRGFDWIRKSKSPIFHGNSNSSCSCSSTSLPRTDEIKIVLTMSRTAWDSEIESLTSLIKLHQNEQRSAPCGQIGAGMQPPVLATSPTLKKFSVARAFEVR